MRVRDVTAMGMFGEHRTPPYYRAPETLATNACTAARSLRTAVLRSGADIVAIGKAAITNHDFPMLVQADPTAAMRQLPVPKEVLAAEGLGPAFLDYMSTWDGFVGQP